MKIDKDYLIGQLEKKIGDLDYYIISNEKVKRKVINDTSAMVRQLKKITTEDKLSIPEQKSLDKVFDFLKKLRKYLK